MSNRTTNHTKAKRERLIKERGSICAWCGKEGYVEVDHILEVVNGGRHADSNLRLLCYVCHRKRHGQRVLKQNHFGILADAEYWRAKSQGKV